MDNHVSLTKIKSLPTRERGLKQLSSNFDAYVWESLPTRERGLKQRVNVLNPSANVSLPTRERGLKHLSGQHGTLVDWSLPTRERGLKRLIMPQPSTHPMVAPHAGAWIETRAGNAN